MTLTDSSIYEALISQGHLLIIAAIGGLILFAFSVAEHFNKSEEDKLSIVRYFAWFLFLFVGLATGHSGQCGYGRAQSAADHCGASRY